MKQNQQLGKPLYLFSMSEFSSLTLPALDLVRARKICEIGSEFGGNTVLLHSWLKARNGDLISVDPAPAKEFLDWIPGQSGFVHISKTSIDCITQVGACDAWFIDGDHNWYTVYNELKLIHEAHQKEGKPVLAFLHDVGWPCGRRDMYYAPDRIPANFRHEFTVDGGIVPGNNGIAHGGLNGGGKVGWATHEGGGRNGVLTAVEDFMSSHLSQYVLVRIPAVLGLGVLWSECHPKANELASLFSMYNENPLIARMEENRLANIVEAKRLKTLLYAIYSVINKAAVSILSE